ncbi:hypothetical protein LTR85_002722 [Meristemomyces frigidus]|nr:hypothetical protein LTR85_002722 [Meristemomyces frigidus]
MLRLVESKNISELSCYVALSHTWGPSSGILTATQKTLDERKLRIPLTSLPANFREAAVVAQAFGVQYLWIDSLCIIQDSESDWALESANMHRIYAHSYLTIAATRASSSTDGFLQHRRAKERAALRFVIDPITQTVGEFYASIRDGHWLEADHEKYVEDSCWNQRGWTLQERILSKRVLHFTDHMLYYECRCLDWMEDNRPAYAAVTRTPWLGSGPAGFHEDYHRESPTTSLYDSWYMLVERYSARSLTKVEDKLPALSGVAHEMAKLSGDQYLAGLWRSDLASSLLWNPNGRASVPAKSYRCPSWSWAQIDGQVSISREPGRSSCFSVLQAVVTPETTDDMGRARSGHLTLRGKIANVTSIRSQGGSENSDNFSHNMYAHDTVIAQGRLDTWTESIEREGLSAMLIMTEPGKRDWKLAVMTGLLLQSDESATPCFRRIGTFIITNGQAPRSGRFDLFDHTAEQEVCLI